MLIKHLCRKERRYKISSTLPFVRKYGPSTRQVLHCADPIDPVNSINSIDWEIKDAVENICKPPLDILVATGGGYLPRREASNLIFIRRPQREMEFEEVISFIPTPHLIGIFENQYCNVANKHSLWLFCELSSHAYTRTAAGWAHEKAVHEHLGMGGTALTISKGNHHEAMQPSTRILPGTLGGLKQADVYDSFYWMPSASNLEGVDSVLGTEDGRVYTIQATIMTHHKDPMEGINKVWDSFLPEVRTRRTWHFVVIADTELTADTCVERFSKELHRFKLGDQKSVKVWGCVLGPPSPFERAIMRRLVSSFNL